jgi:DNA-binding NarL/FixJ family response regulator
MIRLLLVDDQSIIREGLRNLLQAQPDLTVVGEASNGKEALEQAIALLPDVILMDVRMPIMDGVAATGALAQQVLSASVLVLTTFDDDDYIAQAMRRGAKGYLLKDTPSTEIAEAIRLVHRGCTHMGPGLFEKLLATPAGVAAESVAAEPVAAPSELAELTPREREVLELIAEGCSNREIAQRLYIAERTVKNHVNSILNRLGLRDRTQAAILATKFL